MPYSGHTSHFRRLENVVVSIMLKSDMHLQKSADTKHKETQNHYGMQRLYLWITKAQPDMTIKIRGGINTDNKQNKQRDHLPPCYRLRGRRFQNETFHFGSNPHLEKQHLNILVQVKQHLTIQSQLRVTKKTQQYDQR